MKQLHSQRGAALIFVLFALMMLSGIVYHWLTRENQLLREQAYQNTLYQALSYQGSIEDWVMQRMANDNRDVDSLDEAWNQSLPPFPVEGGMIQGELVDAQSQWNINSLYNSSTAKENTQLVETLRYQEQLLASYFLDPILDWLDPDEEQRPQGAEGYSYSQAPQGSAPANGAMIDPSQLALVRNLTQPALDWLWAHFTVLPQATPLNINTAPLENLVLLDALIPISTWQQFAEQRQNAPFEQVTALHTWLKEWLTLDEVSLTELISRLNSSTISINSQYFWLNTTIQLGDHAFRFKTLLHRNDQGKFVRVHRQRL
jgi:general secretion pathway protein K